MVFGLDALSVVLDPDRARLLAGGFYDLTNPVSHKPRMLLMYVMAAVRIRDVPGAWHLAHKISPRIYNGLKEKLAELLRLVNRQRQRLVYDIGHKVIRLVGGEHDKGHRLQGLSVPVLLEIPLVGVLLQARV